MHPKEMRESLVRALLDPKVCLAQLELTFSDSALCLDNFPKITITDEDLLLGTTEHNRPLDISVNIGRFKLSRVLVDPGASINIMNLRVPRSLGN
ncbi:hypothetical protein MA16_Dca026174 [Dendrobium catenatum]|uniref:Uncharacterized protein n=1 Tax=Dendrobium catenatum TaxID=906689 RepID=A0A2I0VPF7_9ASPA|nr:hypothetical protein MA16_Dca026174 [Dendrobium catenatum]